VKFPAVRGTLWGMNPFHLFRSSIRPTRLFPSLLMAIALAVGAGACGDSDSTDKASSSASEPGSMRSVGVKEFNELIQGDSSIQLIDVRRPDEFAAGHIEGATLIDFESADFDTKIAALDKSAKYAIYCRSGNRSGQALDRMKEAGFTQVTNLDGGVIEWTAAGLDLV
jgi:phage shock protein E